MTITSRYDQIAGEPYGRCATCELVVETEEACRAHTRETFEASTNHTSHSVRILNPSRPDRIRDALDSLVDRAVDDLMGQFLDMMWDGDASEDEITAAAKRLIDVDLGEAWEQALEEASD